MHQNAWFSFIGGVVALATVAVAAESPAASPVGAVAANVDAAPANPVTPATPARPAVEPPVVADGFVANIFASAPDITSPASMCVSPEGVVFVGEDPYNQGAGTEPGLGRVRMCMDTDGDGAADRFTLFADKLNSPQGTCFVDGTLYVTHAPFFSAFRDLDRDGKADFRDDLITGLGPEPTGLVHHVPSGVRMGIDGWLYISIGDKGIPEATAKDGSKVRMQGGGVVRVRPDGTHLEAFSWGQRNIYDVSVDPLRNVYTRDNTNDGNGWNSFVTLVQRDAQYGYPNLYKNYADEAAPHVADYGGGSATGSLYVHDGTWPGGWGQALYTCDWVKGTVYRHQMTPDGAGYTLTSDDFLKCGDPTDLDIDAAGRFYVADWARRTWSASDDRGVIFRVVPKGHPSTQPSQASTPALPNFEDDTAAQLVAHLSAPRAVWRLAAQRQLLRRGASQEATAQLILLLASNEPLFARAGAIYTLLQLNGTGSVHALVTAARIPELREIALAALADHEDVLSASGAEPFMAYLDDPNPRVRVQSAVALGRLGDATAGTALVALTADTDVRVCHAALRAMRELKAADACFAVLGDASAKPEIVEGALRVLRDLHSQANVTTLRTLMDQSTDPARKIALLKVLARLYNREGEWDNGWWSPWPGTTGPYVKAVTWEQSPVIASTIATHVGDPNTDLAKAAIEMAGQFVINEAAPTLAKIALSDGPNQADAVSAMTRLSVDDATVRATLQKIATLPVFTPEQRIAAVDALNKIENPDGLTILIRLAEVALAEPDAPSLVVEKIGNTLAERRAEEAAVSHLAKLTHCNVSAIRAGAAAALLRSDVPAAKEVVLKLYGDSDASAVETVLRALTRVPVDAARAYVEQIRPLLNDKRNPVRHAATAAVGYVGDTDSIPALLKLTARAIDRTPVMQALTQIGPEKTSDDQILAVTKFIAESASSLAGSSDLAAYTKALQGAERFLQDKRLPLEQVNTLSALVQKAGIIADFMTLGPIPAPTTDSFAATFAPETAPAGPFEPFSVGETKYEWSPLKITQIEGQHTLAMPNNSVQYFAAKVDSPSAGPAVLSVRSDDGVRVWLNGEKVHEKDIGRSLTNAGDQVHLTLTAGENTLLIRVNNVSGGSGIAARVRHRVGEFEPAELGDVMKDRPVDLERGKALFTALGCVQCHTTNPEESSKGPFLGDAGGKFNREQLIEAILRPNATIAQGFTTQRVVTKQMSKSDELLGFVVRETPEQLELRDLTGKVTTLAKSDILTHQQRPQSMMPQGLADALPPDEFAMLISYLESLKPAAPQ